MRTLDRRALPALLRRPALARLLAVLNGAGEEARVVGGAVRNTLLGRPVTDIDIAGTAVPEEVVRRVAAAGFAAVPTGLAHGTLTVVAEGGKFEVTTLREDIETDGRHARVRFGRDFRADAGRRDFTMNALYADAGGRLFDDVGGLADLEAGVVRFIGDPATRIREDYLRILRFFRFHAGFAEGPPDAAGLAAVGRERAGLAQLSPERVRNEVLKLLLARRAAETLAVMAGHGFLLPLLGGVAEAGRFGRAAAAGLGAAARLAALAVATAEDAARLRELLRLSNAEEGRLADHARLIARLKTADTPLSALDARRLAADEEIGLVTETLAILAGEPRPRLDPGAAAALVAFRNGAEPVPVFPLRGRDLVAAGVPKGPALGERLAAARRRWLAAGCPAGPEAARALLAEALREPSTRI